MRGRNRQADPQTRRIPIAAPISLELGGGQELAAQISNLSQGGFFVVSASPGRVGLTARFELAAVAGWQPITGEARVAWARGFAEAPDRPTGMGMTITDVAALDRRRLRAVILHHLRTGALPEGQEPELLVPEPPETSRIAPADDVAFPGFITTSRPALLPHTAPSRARIRLVAIAATLLLAALAGAWWNRVGPRQPVGPTPGAAAGSDRELPAAAESPAPTHTPRTEPPAVTLPADPTPARPTADLLSVEPEIRQVVAAWSRAWQAQQTEAYLDCYSSRFQPEGATPRTAWERQRRQRLSSPEFIELTLSEVRIDVLGAQRAQATFRQVYRSDRYADEVEKLLLWVREGERWRILAERSNGEPAP
jgi:PilZ domain